MEQFATILIMELKEKFKKTPFFISLFMLILLVIYLKILEVDFRLLALQMGHKRYNNGKN
jgi:hypothetical protein